MRTVYQYIADSALTHPDKPAIICDQEVLTYSQLIFRSEAIASTLIVEEIRKGSKVFVLVDTQSTNLAVIYAIMRTGGIALPISEHISLASLTALAKHCSPGALLTTRAVLHRYALLPELLDLRVILIDDIFPQNGAAAGTKWNGTPVLRIENTDRITKFANIQPTDGAIAFTATGSSAQDDGLILSHDDLASGALFQNRSCALRDSDIEFSHFPFGSQFAIRRAISVHVAGGTIVTTQHLKSDNVVRDLIRSNSCTVISGPQSMLDLFHETGSISCDSIGLFLLSPDRDPHEILSGLAGRLDHSYRMRIVQHKRSHLESFILLKRLSNNTPVPMPISPDKPAYRTGHNTLDEFPR